jgi:NADH-quinone oxidoreductase subunit F
MVCLESRDIMPAYQSEVELAESEGIRVFPCWGVKQILGENGKASGVQLKSCTAVFDKEGRFSPTYDEAATCVIAADTVVAAIGQTTDLSFADPEMKAGPRLNTDLDTQATPVKGVYAGGDVASTIRSIVQAISAGKRAAISIDLFLKGKDQKALIEAGRGALSVRRYLAEGDARPENRAPEEPETAFFGPGTRLQPVMLAPESRVGSHDEVSKGLSREDAVTEARRCFRCSHYAPPIVLYPDECWFCGTCVEECPAPGAITMVAPLNQRVGWKRKETGEMYRLGMKDPPPPYTVPAMVDSERPDQRR